MCLAYGLNDRLSIPGESKVFLFFTAFRPTLRSTKPSSQSIQVYPQGAKRPECYADYCLFVMTKFRQSLPVYPLSLCTVTYLLMFVLFGYENFSSPFQVRTFFSAQNPSVSVVHAPRDMHKHMVRSHVCVSCIGIPERKRLFERPKRRLGDNINVSIGDCVLAGTSNGENTCST